MFSIEPLFHERERKIELVDGHVVPEGDVEPVGLLAQKDVHVRMCFEETGHLGEDGSSRMLRRFNVDESGNDSVVVPSGARAKELALGANRAAFTFPFLLRNSGVEHRRFIPQHGRPFCVLTFRFSALGQRYLRSETLKTSIKC